MQGVRLVRTPPKKTKGIALSGFPERLGKKLVRSTVGLVTGALSRRQNE
jgi:hypothetical protein